MPSLPIRERRESIVRLTANDVEVAFDEAALVTSQATPAGGIPGRISWELVVRNASVSLAGEVVVVVALKRATMRGTARVISDDRQAGGGFSLRTTVLAGAGDLVSDPSPN